MTESSNLLVEYVQTGSGEVFRKLVAQYADLVYSTALRSVDGDTHRAEDITQTVFIDLARTAGTLSGDVMLGGWLHRHTCFVAAHIMRGERRRQSREREAAQMNALHDDSGQDFSLVAPTLDEAIDELGESDRAAILLRFFEQRDFRSIGQVLGSNEDAARMRVSRALDKLQASLKRRGLTTTAAALSVTLSANAIQAAPIGLVVTVSNAAALAGTALHTPAGIASSKLIAMTTLQKTIIATALAVAVGTGIYEARQAAKARADMDTLRQQQRPPAEQISQLERERDDYASKLEALREENERLNRNSDELLRMRGELALLRGLTNEFAVLNASNKSLSQLFAQAGSSIQTNSFYRTNVYSASALRNVGLEKLDEAIEIALYGLWTGDPVVCKGILTPGSLWNEMTNASQILVTQVRDFYDGSAQIMCQVQHGNTKEHGFGLLILKMRPVNGQWNLDSVNNSRVVLQSAAAQ